MAFDAIAQLEQIIRRWDPKQRLDIQGIVLDYIYRSGQSLFHVFTLNHAIYDRLFVEAPREEQCNLLQSVASSPDERKALKDLCSQHFPLVAQLLTEPSDTFSSAPVQVAVRITDVIGLAGSGVRPKAVVWQLSDIHFGKFNVWLEKPEELAASLGLAVGMYGALRPDYVVVSGDVSSVAADSEFREFCQFCTRLSTELWGGPAPQRILVVPGNHDTSWRPDGTADHLEKFARIVGQSGTCITPFGAADQFYNNPSVSVSRVNGDTEDVPPYALVNLRECGLSFLLLVTSYYSGFVPDELRCLLMAGVTDPGLRERLISHLRTDIGQIGMQYLSNLARRLGNASSQTIAVTHHHLAQYGAHVNLNPNAFQLLKLLRNKGIHHVFHGHLHLFEDEENVRGLVPQLAYCIPCTTIMDRCLPRWRFLRQQLNQLPVRHEDWVY